MDAAPETQAVEIRADDALADAERARAEEVRADLARRQHDWALERATKRRWYGGQTLGVDAAAGGLFALTVPAVLVFPPAAVLTFGGSFVTYVLGPPGIHLVHGRPDAAAWSLGMRVLGPPVGALLALTAVSVGRRIVDGPPPPRSQDVDGGDRSGFGIALMGAGLSIPVVIALDAALLAWDPPALLPMVEATPGGGALHVGGRF